MGIKKKLLGMTKAALRGVVADVGLPGYADSQIADWLYKKKVASVSDMTNLSIANRAKLDERYEVGVRPPVQEMRSVDGTVKYLFEITEKNTIETVYIPAAERATLCVSSQVGCKMNCLFCMTGKQGFAANLTANEMMNQIRSIPEADTLTNLVFMGMGEPLDNTDELLNVLEILTSDYGYAWSPKRITVSTVGVTKGLIRFLDESNCHLAVSLHSPFPAERSALMPVEKAFPSHEIIELIRKYDFAHQRRVSFEYIVFKDLNDTPRHAAALAELLKGIPCRVNLIRFHAIPDADLKSPNNDRMEAFRDRLNAKNIVCTIRASRGEDIFAACGMLSSAKTKGNRVD